MSYNGIGLGISEPFTFQPFETEGVAERLGVDLMADETRADVEAQFPSNTVTITVTK